MCAYLKLLTEVGAAGVLVLEMCAAAELGLFSIFTIFADLNQNDSPKTTKAKNAETVRRAEKTILCGFVTYDKPVSHHSYSDWMHCYCIYYHTVH